MGAMVDDFDDEEDFPEPLVVKKVGGSIYMTWMEGCK